MKFKIKKPSRLITSLQLMKHRQKSQGIKPSDAPLNDSEELVLQAIYREYEKKELSKEPGYKRNTKEFLDETIKVFGKRAVVEISLSDNMIFGIPYWWAVANGFVFFGTFQIFRDFSILFGGMLTVHLIAYFYTKNTFQKKRNEKIDYILKGY